MNFSTAWRLVENMLPTLVGYPSKDAELPKLVKATVKNKVH